VQNPDQPIPSPAWDGSTPIQRDESGSNFQSPPIDPNNPSWGVGKALLVWLASLVLMFLVPVIFILPYAAIKGFNNFDPLDKTSILLQVISLLPTHLLTFAIIWMVVTRFGKQSFGQAIGWSWSRGVRLWSCIGLGMLLFIMGTAIAKMLGGDKPTQLEQIINSSLAARYTISFLAVFTAPVVEELIYRGVLYAPLQRLLGMPWAVVLVLCLFTLIHVPQYWPNTGVIVAVGLLSIVLTIIRAYSGRLLPCIVIHFVFNGIQAVLLILEPHLHRFMPTGNPPVPPGFLLAHLLRCMV
jgi:membrane protease YdiL (CAAX protease family)